MYSDMWLPLAPASAFTTLDGALVLAAYVGILIWSLRALLRFKTTSRVDR